MKRRLTIIPLAIIAFVAACSSPPKPKIEFDSLTAFNTYSAFDFVAGNFNSNPSAIVYEDDIRRAVQIDLTKKGMLQAGMGKMMLVSYSILAASLELQFIDAETTRQIWYGSIALDLPPVPSSKDRKKVDDAVAALLADYPPKAPK